MKFEFNSREDPLYGRTYCVYNHYDRRNKGTHNLHSCPRNILVYKNGRKISVNKTEKPEGKTLIRYIMDVAGVSHKEASRALKDFSANC
jgi:hypothetical protein